jgi:hypothetical protein
MELLIFNEGTVLMIEGVEGTTDPVFPITVCGNGMGIGRLTLSTT